MPIETLCRNYAVHLSRACGLNRMNYDTFVVIIHVISIRHYNKCLIIAKTSNHVSMNCRDLCTSYYNIKVTMNILY